MNENSPSPAAPSRTDHPQAGSSRTGSSRGPGPRTVLVTGAGTGIGRATARAFAAEGARVVAVGRRAAPLAETAEGHPGITLGGDQALLLVVAQGARCRSGHLGQLADPHARPAPLPVLPPLTTLLP